MTEADSRFRLKWNIVTVLTVSMVLTIALLMSLSTFLEIRREQSIFRAQLQEKGLLIFDAMEGTVSTTSGIPNELEMNRLIAMVEDRPDVSRFQFYSPDGSILTDYHTSNSLANPRANLSSNAVRPEVTFPSGMVQVSGPLKSGDQITGFVLLQFNNSEFSEQTRQLAIQRIIQTLVLIGIGIGISYFIAKRFASPIKRLALATEKVGRGEFDANAGVDPNRDDEIGELAASFSNMIKALKESRERLDKALQEEQHNTAELAKANEVNISMMRELEVAQERTIQNSKMAALGQLASGVAHEINNPLAAILGFSQLGKKKLASLHNTEVSADDISYMERYLDYIETQAQRCGQIVSRMITYDLSPGQESSDLDMNDMVEQAIRMNSNQMSSMGIDTKLHLAKDLPSIKGHTAGLVQAFNNVVTNAIGAMPEGGTFKIESHLIKPDKPNDYATIEICFKDTGVGISEENIPRVIEPFFTTAEPGGGTGLGMYSSYQVIRQHDGDIKIESHEGDGTTVKITFRVPKSDDEISSELQQKASDD